MATSMTETPLRLKCALVVRGAFDRSIVPAFRAATGCVVETDWAPTTVIMTRLAAGEQADAVVVIDEAMDRLIEAGRADPATRIEVVASRIGVAVKAGAPHPDIATVDALKRALLAARSVCYSRGGASGIYFGPLLDRLGIAKGVNAKATLVPAGLTAEKLVTGEADIAIQQISELMVVEGIEVVGALPKEVQKVTAFSAAILNGATTRAAAERFLLALGSEDATAAYAASGLDPAGSLA